MVFRIHWLSMHRTRMTVVFPRRISPQVAYPRGRAPRSLPHHYHDPTSPCSFQSRSLPHRLTSCILRCSLLVCLTGFSVDPLQACVARLPVSRVTLRLLCVFVFQKLPATFGSLVVAVDKFNFNSTLGIPPSDRSRGQRAVSSATGSR